jgi:integrase
MYSLLESDIDVKGRAYEEIVGSNLSMQRPTSGPGYATNRCSRPSWVSSMPNGSWTDITPVDIEGYKLHRRQKVSGATVNRELALLKRMFNLAIDWDLYLGSNPVRKVKFFQEFNRGKRILTPSEEENLIRNATPYLQDIIPFALNTGLRIGEIFILLWSNVDWEKGVLNVFAHKTGKIRVIPMNTETRRILETG